jgi:hypothetical protein
MFLSAGFIGQDEWRAARDPDEDNAERGQCQFVWAIPYEVNPGEELPLAIHQIVTRQTGLARGQFPADWDFLTVHLDIGKYSCHWAAVAWKDGSGSVVDYGVIEVHTDSLGLEASITGALREYRDMCMTGFPDGAQPDQAWIDAGYQTPTIYDFIARLSKKEKAIFRPARGLGTSEDKVYSRPKKETADVIYVGREFHIQAMPAAHVRLVEVNADFWKSWAFKAWQNPVGGIDTLALFAADAREHVTFAKHITAERQETEFKVGKGNQTKWVKVYKHNHYLDCIYNCCAAHRYCVERAQRRGGSLSDWFGGQGK